MRDKMLIIIIVALALALVGETAYITKNQQGRNFYITKRSRHAPVFLWSERMRPKSDLGSWDPLNEMAAIHQRINRLFQDSLARGFLEQNNGSLADQMIFEPSTDIKDTKDAYVVTADLPGIDKGQINVEVRNNHLVISGKKNDETESQNGTFFKKERQQGSFESDFVLPENVDTNAITAQYTKGVLTVTIPKTQLAGAQQNATKIKIN